MSENGFRPSVHVWASLGVHLSVYLRCKVLRVGLCPLGPCGRAWEASLGWGGEGLEQERAAAGRSFLRSGKPRDPRTVAGVLGQWYEVRL